MRTRCPLLLPIEGARQTAKLTDGNYGRGRRSQERAEAGDFIYVPPYVPHQEINALAGDRLSASSAEREGKIYRTIIGSPRWVSLI